MASEDAWDTTPSPGEGERYVRPEPVGREHDGEHRTAAERARSEARSLAEAGREDLAIRIGGFGRALRRAGERLREEDGESTARLSDLLAERADRISHFLEEHDSDALLHEVDDFARRRPLFFLGGCLIAGLAIGRFLKASPQAGASSEREGGEALAAPEALATPEVAPIVADRKEV